MSAIKFDLRGKDALFLGHSRTIRVQVTGEDQAPLNLTGYTATWVLKTGARAATDIVRKTEADGISFADQDASPGLLEITIDAVDTTEADFPPGGKLYHQLDLTIGSVTEPAMYGDVEVRPVGILPEV